MNEAARLETAGEGRYRISGPLNVASVPTVWPALARLATGGGDTDVSLAGVTHADSAAVACLVAGMRAARAAGGRIRFADLPESMRVIVDVSDLESLFPAVSPQA